MRRDVLVGIGLLLVLCGCTGKVKNRAGTPQNSKATGVWEAVAAKNAGPMQIILEANGHGVINLSKNKKQEIRFEWKEEAGKVTLYSHHEFMQPAVYEAQLSPDATSLKWYHRTLKRSAVNP